MIEHVKELPVDAQLHALGHCKPLRNVKITRGKERPAQCVAPQIAVLAVLDAVAAWAGAGAWIKGRNKRIRVEPLDRPWLRHTRNGLMFIKRNAGHNTGILRPASLHDPASVGGVGRAQNGKGNPAAPEHRPRYLPAVNRVAEHPIPHLDW